MKLPANRYRCPLGDKQPHVTDLEDVKRTGWREQHILVVSAADARLDFIEREIVHRIGERLYGCIGEGRRHD